MTSRFAREKEREQERRQGARASEQEKERSGDIQKAPPGSVMRKREEKKRNNGGNKGLVSQPQEKHQGATKRRGGFRGGGTRASALAKGKSVQIDSKKTQSQRKHLRRNTKWERAGGEEEGAGTRRCVARKKQTQPRTPIVPQPPRRRI